jgi:hypothetical protein
MSVCRLCIYGICAICVCTSVGCMRPYTPGEWDPSTQCDDSQQSKVEASQAMYGSKTLHPYSPPLATLDSPLHTLSALWLHLEPLTSLSSFEYICHVPSCKYNAVPIPRGRPPSGAHDSACDGPGTSGPGTGSAEEVPWPCGEGTA